MQDKVDAFGVLQNIIGDQKIILEKVLSSEYLGILSFRGRKVVAKMGITEVNESHQNLVSRKISKRFCFRSMSRLRKCASKKASSVL